MDNLRSPGSLSTTRPENAPPRSTHSDDGPGLPTTKSAGFAASRCRWSNADLSYDLADRVTALKDYDGQTTRFEYDLADRLTRRQLADGTEVKFTYTTGGRRATAEDARGVTSYTYDATGRMTKSISRTQGLFNTTTTRTAG